MPNERSIEFILGIFIMIRDQDYNQLSKNGYARCSKISMDKIGHPIWRKWGKEVYSGQLFPQK
jgi:hypothetical protein